MRMLFSAIVASTILMSAPSHAEPGEHSFEYDGVSYTYTETVDGDRTILRGTASPGGSFRLIIEDGIVRGYSGVGRVHFSVAEAYAMAGADLVELASTDD
ncbi:hypothetical protein [Parasphingopyxis marina]|uniref:Uncharacterized protein n=1 Tax=Parasphingopyxis marina TaxID=2761622 RepID=A0A842HVT6_9SPHN|nr:hypothetical protein [Parasphingopyxis marina]MBC2776481.1 hypothetical protein [Parasphingopyxis marina]